MYDREKIEKTEKIIEKGYHSGVFFLNNGWRNCVKPNFQGGGIRAGVKRVGVN